MRTTESQTAMYLTAPEVAGLLAHVERRQVDHGRDPEERARYIAERVAEQEAEMNLLRLSSELMVDAVVEPAAPGAAVQGTRSS